MLETVRSLLDGGSEREQLHAIRLAVAAFRMPCGDIGALVHRLIELPAPLNLQRDLYIALALSGERLQAGAIQSCIRALFAESTTKPWVLGDNHSAFFGWVEMLAFSERPAAMLDEVTALDLPRLKAPYQLRGLMAALGASTEPEVEEILLRFAALIPGLASEYEWLAALRTRGTETSGRALLRLLQDGVLEGRGHRDTDELGPYLAQLAEEPSGLP